MADIFGGFSGMGVWVKYIAWFGGLLIFCLGITALILWVLVLSKQKKIVVLDMVTRRCEFINGKLKKNKSHQKQLYIPKYKKFLPMVQQEDVFTKGKRDVIVLLRDNNRLYHTARLPNMEELIGWYKSVDGFDLDKKVKEIQSKKTVEEKRTIMDKLKDSIKGVKIKDALNVLSTVFLMPNPAEDLEWLADEQNEANKSFKTGILKHPLLVWISTIAICSFTFIVTIVISNKG